jgi:hypothetical protein
MSEQKTRRTITGTDALGIGLAALGGLFAVSIVLHLNDQVPTTDSWALPVLGLVSSIGAWPGLLLALGVAACGAWSFLVGRALPLGRFLLACVGLALGASIVVGALPGFLGGELGATLPAVLPGKLGLACALAIGITVGYTSGWLLWLALLPILVRKPGTLGPVVADSRQEHHDGVSAAEAAALVPQARPLEAGSVAPIARGTRGAGGAASPAGVRSTREASTTFSDVRVRGGVPQGARPLDPEGIRRKQDQDSRALEDRQHAAGAARAAQEPAAGDVAAARAKQELIDQLGRSKRELAGSRPASESLATPPPAGPARELRAGEGTAPEMGAAQPSARAAMSWESIEEGGEPGGVTSETEESARATIARPAWESLEIGEEDELGEPVPYVAIPQAPPAVAADRGTEGTAIDVQSDEDFDEDRDSSAHDPSEEFEEGLEGGFQQQPAQLEESEASMAEASEALAPKPVAQPSLFDTQAAGSTPEHEPEPSTEPTSLAEVVVEPAPRHPRAAKVFNPSARASASAPAPIAKPARTGAPKAVQRRVPERTYEPASAEPETAALEAGLDPIAFQAGLLFLDQNRVAVSMLQRHFQVDFDRACAILDQLQAAGLIGPYMGGKAREILMTKEQWLSHQPQS